MIYNKNTWLFFITCLFITRKYSFELNATTAASTLVLYVLRYDKLILFPEMYLLIKLLNCSHILLSTFTIKLLECIINRLTILLISIIIPLISARSTQISSSTFLFLQKYASHFLCLPNTWYGLLNKSLDKSIIMLLNFYLFM